MILDISKEKNFWFLLGLFGISYGIFLMVSHLEHCVPDGFHQLFKLFHGFTIPIIFYTLLKLFDKHLWKCKIWQKLKIIEFPNLNGTYKGKFTSSAKDEKGENHKGEVTFEIKQTASKILVKGLFKLSESISTKAFFSFNDLRQKTCLYYFYVNNPNKKAADDMNMHEGSTILSYDEKTKKLSGEYTSGRGRNDYGSIEVRKIK